jgi:sigma-B regulation protein RsbU (phosphoserine phosphatase)
MKRYRYRTRSFMVVPLKSQGRIVGVLAVTERMDARPFSGEDLEIVTAIATQLSEAYQNIILYGEAVEKNRMEKELEITYRMQQSLLPETFPEMKGCSIAATSVPALEVGGDIYDYMRLGRERFALYVADVSGKGVPASLFMAMCRSVVRVMGGRMPPAKVLAEANRHIHADSKSGMFVTMFYVLCDKRQRTLRYASAGHERMYLVRSGGKRVTFLKTRGIPLGVLPDARYREAVARFSEGDVLVLVTDGVLDARNVAGEAFGEERLLSVVQQTARGEPSDIVDEIRRALSDFTGEAPQFDDLTLVVVKFH